MEKTPQKTRKVILPVQSLPDCAHFAGAVLHGLAHDDRCLETVHHPASLRTVQQEHSRATCAPVQA